MQTVADKPGTYDRYSSFILLEMEKRTATATNVYTSTFYRFTTAPRDITYSGAAGWDRPAVGAVFTAKGLQLGAIVMNSAMNGAAQAVFGDQDDTIKSIVLLNNMDGWRVRIWEAGTPGDGTFSVTWIKLLIGGFTEDSEWDLEGGDDVTIDIGQSNPQITSGLRQRFGPGCAHRFGDARCAYPTPESTTCNRTWTRCGELANLPRYGGYRKIPTAGERLPMWGGANVELQPRSTYYPPAPEV